MTLLRIGVILLLLCFLARPALGNSALIYVTTSLVNFDARIVQQWSDGGVDPWTISNDSSHPFTGREFGGVGRKHLTGTPIYGSGYNYGNVDNTTIAGRPFPYGLWPIYWGNNTMGSDEYGPQLDGLRPGGELVTIPLKTQTQYYNVTDNETYYLIGDRDSVLFMMISLVTTCHVTPAWPSKFTPASPNSTVTIDKVIQYYRASSFALAFRGYSNAFALNSTSTESRKWTPLPDIVVYSPFKRCIDDVIVDALAIMNIPPDTDKIGGILSFVFGGFGIPILYVLWFVGVCVIGTVSATRKTVTTKLMAKHTARAARKASLAYESYP